MDRKKFLPLKLKLINRFGDAPSLTVLFSSFLKLTLVLICISGCAPPPDADAQSGSDSNKILEITDETLNKEINDVYLREVPEINGTSEPISWRVDEDEPKKFTIVEKQISGDSATIVLDFETQTAPGARVPKYLSGQMRTKWKLETGWALRTWVIVETENISVKYKNLPKPPEQNSNR